MDDKEVTSELLRRWFRYSPIPVEDTEEDHISKMPDEVLGHILSFIPTKYAVGTSILSKRWLHVWTLVPNLEFDDSLQFNGQKYVDENVFMNFVDRVLAGNELSVLRKFRIDCSQVYDPSRVKAWIYATLTRDAEELELGFDDKQPIEFWMPYSFFNSEKLVDLKLYNNINLDVPASAHFPRLKSLDLESVQFSGDDSMKNLLAACPVLEDLDITRESWDNAGTLYLCSSSLKYLHLHTDYNHSEHFKHLIVVETPNLQYLHLKDYVSDDYIINDLSSVVELVLDIQQNYYLSVDLDVFGSKLYMLLSKVSHVEDLCLSIGTFRSFVDIGFNHFPMFHKLTRLELQITEDSWPIWPLLLTSSPFLQTFVLEKKYSHVPKRRDEPNPIGCKWRPPASVLICVLLSLKEIQIVGLEECEAEMKMVSYFLKNALVLKKMSIRCQRLELKTEHNILRKLLMLPRASMCHIEFLGDFSR